MKLRVITAVIGIILALGIVALGGWVLTGAVLLISLVGLWELWRMLLHAQIKILLIPSAIALAVIIGSAGFYSLPFFAGALCLCFVGILFSILFVAQGRMHDVIYSAFAIIYLGTGFGTMTFLRGGAMLERAVTLAVPHGIFLILTALIGTWASDSFAYLVGKRYGRHKMAPHISPNKTVEGLAGGAVGSIILTTAFCALSGYDLWRSWLLAVFIAVSAPVGDLFESYMKRVCDIKDSGNIIPGHGGVLDRFDSLLFVAPVMLSVLCFVHG